MTVARAVLKVAGCRPQLGVWSFLAMLLPAAAQIPAHITVPPQDQYASCGDTVTFSVQATGSQPLTFSWFRDGIETSNGVASTATKSTITITNVQGADDGADLYVTVVNLYGSDTSADVFLNISPPLILTQPQDQICLPGQCGDVLRPGNRVPTHFLFLV